MREDLFAELLESVKQGGEYLRGKRAPSRAFEVEVPDVKKRASERGLCLGGG